MSDGSKRGTAAGMTTSCASKIEGATSARLVAEERGSEELSCSLWRKAQSGISFGQTDPSRWFPPNRKHPDLQQRIGQCVS